MTSSTLNTQTPAAPDFGALKARQQGAWSSGNYSVVGTTLQIVGESLCEALDLRSTDTVLDVAAGNGNVALAAARRWCSVIATDYVPALLERAQARADADGLAIEFREADAEALPFVDEQFDVVVSTFGVMFTPDQARAAAELLRVCKRGGKIGLANWTPAGYIGQLFGVIGKHLPPPSGVRSPAQWGTTERLGELFGAQSATIAATPRTFAMRYRSPDHMFETFKTYYGPMLKAFATLQPDAQAALEADLRALIGRFNRVTDGTVVIPSEYLEVVVTRR